MTKCNLGSDHISNPARPQVVDSVTVPRYRSQVITLSDQLAIAAEDEVGQAGGAAVLFKCRLNPVKELSGELRCLNNLYPCCSTGSPGGWAATGRNLKQKNPIDNSSSQRVGGRLKPRSDYPNRLLSVLQTTYVRIFRYSTGFFLWMHHQSVKTKQCLTSIFLSFIL